PTTERSPPSFTPMSTASPIPLWFASEIWTFETETCVKLAPSIACCVVLVMRVPSTWRSVSAMTPPVPPERPTPTSEIVDPLTNREPSDVNPRPPNRTVASTKVPDTLLPKMPTPPPGKRFGSGWHEDIGVTGHSGTPMPLSKGDVNTLPGADASTLPFTTTSSPLTTDWAGIVTVPGPSTRSWFV